jgi:vacuolar-type H+-ATPase subunit H
MEFLELVKELERILTSAPSLPGTGRILIDKEKVLDLAARISVAAPQDLEEAQDLLQMREKLMNQALSESRSIRVSAEQEAQTLTRDSEIVKEARDRSDKLATEAQLKAQRILDETDDQVKQRITGADEYAQSILRKLEDDLDELLSTVRRGIGALDVEGESTT